MSYLDPPRLHFAGKFAATISTVNNDPTHFDNATFLPEYQERMADNPPPMNGWFSPRGDGDWRLMGCKVTSAVGADGKPVSGDAVLGYLVADSDRLPPAKLVDLDPEQQLVSEIWGLEMRICDVAGNNLLRAAFQPVGFMDIWTRSIGSGGGDNSAAAMYQSVLHDPEWGDISGSPFLIALQAAAPDGRLSVKFNVDGINLNWNDPDFLRGRITGTIGVAAPGEPDHFVRGRQFMATSSGAQGFPVPSGGLNNCVASVDATNQVIRLDLGNALPTGEAGGPLADIGKLTLFCNDPASPQAFAIGDIAYTGADWYETTAGVVDLPIPAEAQGAVPNNQLWITKPESGGSAYAIAEPPTGLHCRADQFVYRLEAGEAQSIRVYASQFGQPYANARIRVIQDPYQLQPYPGAPPPGVPTEVLSFPDTIQADVNGVAPLRIAASAPGNPRGYIDGQVYGIRPMLAETVAPGAVYPFDMWEFVSVLVFDSFVPDEPPTWWGSLQPIFQQYANLYPLMADIVDLADYDSVCAMREMLLMAFEQPIESPNSMPVTRDLSKAKRAAILRWLREVGPDGKPLPGPLVAPRASARPRPAGARAEGLAAAEANGGPPPGIDPAQGGKAAAAARRLAINAPGAPR